MEKEDNLRREWQEFIKEPLFSDLTFARFCQLKREEDNASKIQEQAKDMQLEGSSHEEPNAKCCVCGAGLMVIENMLYGNRCIFCAPVRYGYRLMVYMLSCYYDRKIYYQLMKLIELKGKEDAKRYFDAVLGNMGYQDINQVKTLKAKKLLIKELACAKKMQKLRKEV